MPRESGASATRPAPRRLIFWRRRVVALGCFAGLGIATWGVFGDGTSDGTSDATQASTLSVRELAGERLIAGFSGPRPPTKLVDMIERGEAAGVILFSENLGTRRHARHLIRRLQRTDRPPAVRNPLLVMIDQEGGLVKRLDGPPNASAQVMGRRGPAYSRRQGAKTARNLRDVGVNVDLAPVLDVGRRGSAIRAEHRSFGSRPRRVIATAIPFAAAMQSHGVAATAKHFPGLGAAPENTDFATQRIPLHRSTLRRVDERPYGPFAERGGDIVMLSTATYPHLSRRPAAFSAAVATGELRDRIGFQGVSITDALETVSAASFGGPPRVAQAAARAGTDLALFTDYRDAARGGRALRRALRSGKLERGPFEESAERVLDLRGRLP